MNLFGNFEFSVRERKWTVDALAALFADARYWSQALKDIQEVPLS